MSTEEQERNATDEAEKKSAAARAGWRAYQQLAAAFSAFGLIAMCGDYFGFGFGWRDYLAPLLSEAWNEYIQEPIHYLVHYLIEMPLGLFGRSAEVPRWVDDYLAIGVLQALSALRVELSLRRGKWAQVFRYRPSAAAMVRTVLVSLLAWPLTLVAQIVDAARGQAGRVEFIEAVVAALPVAWFGLQLIVKYLMLR